jgi:signal transduction histidine kinase
MQEISVQVENDHIERLTSAKPLIALSELIWNSYDADAREVYVDFEEGSLTKLGIIRIADDGVGVPYEKAPSFFSRWVALGKKEARRPMLAACFMESAAKDGSKPLR